MHARLSRRARTLAAATATLVAATGVAALGSPAPAHAAAGPFSQTFTATANAQFTVPSWVTSIHVHAVGGSGARGYYLTYSSLGGLGGHGGVVDVDIPVTPNEVLDVRPGGAGAFSGPGLGLYSNGGVAGPSDDGGGSPRGGIGNGGAASFVDRRSTGQVLVAAGGGGGGGDGGIVLYANGGTGGDGGGYAGSAGDLSGGSGGRGSSGSDSGGHGGGAGSNTGAGGGGGGGGGWLPSGTGGGQGGSAGTGAGLGVGGGGGAGGQSYAVVPFTPAVATTTGDGSVTISWGAMPTSGTLTPYQPAVTLGTPVHWIVSVGWPDYSITPTGTVTVWAKSSVSGSTSVIGQWDASTTWNFDTPNTIYPVGTVEAWVTYDGDTYHQPYESVHSIVTILPQMQGPTKLGFGFLVVGTSTTKSLTLTNLSSLIWTPASISLSGGAFTMAPTSTCGAAPVAPGGTCKVAIKFKPTDTKFAGATLSILDTFGNTTAISLTGRGVLTPTITAVAPYSGSHNGGNAVTITGTNLIGITAVKFGSADATRISCLIPTRCTVTTPAGPAGLKVPVTATNVAGTSPTASNAVYHYV